MARYFPFIPVVGARNKIPAGLCRGCRGCRRGGLAGRAQAGATYELGGPEAKSFGALIEDLLKVTERDRPIVKLSFSTGKLVAGITEFFTKLSLGLFPTLLRMTGDQVELLKHDNVVCEAAVKEGRTLQGLGIEPRSIEAIAPTYLYRYRKTGQYQAQRMGA